MSRDQCEAVDLDMLEAVAHALSDMGRVHYANTVLKACVEIQRGRQATGAGYKTSEVRP